MWQAHYRKLQGRTGLPGLEAPCVEAPALTALQMLDSPTFPARRSLHARPGMLSPRFSCVQGLRPLLSTPPHHKKSSEAFHEGFLNVLQSRMDKYELDGNPVRCVGLQCTTEAWVLVPARVLTSHVALAVHLTSPHLQNEDNICHG